MTIPELRDLPVLVTGGAGFIGSHLTDELVRRGARVRVFDNFSNGRRENLADSAASTEVIEGDLRDLEACRAAAQGMALVFHQAALGSVPRSMADPTTSLAVNAQGTAHMLTAAREAGVERFVYASSSSVYGDSPSQLRREGEEGRPLSPYAASKRMTEELAEVFGIAYGLRTVGLRYFNIYGPRQDPDGPYAAVVPRFFKAALGGERPVIFGDGEQTRDFTYVADAVRANLLAAGAPEAANGRAFNVAGGAATSINRLAELVFAQFGKPAEPRHEAPRPGDVKHSLADLELARQHLGFAPQTELADGLARSRAGYERILPPAGS
jgi:nucleoside-diphosphate-sugar epimerase